MVPYHPGKCRKRPSNIITNLPKTLLTKKLLRAPQASSRWFRKSCKDPLTGCILIVEGLLRHFPGRYDTTLGFALFSASSGCLRVSETTGVVCLCVFRFFYVFRTCRVGLPRCTYLIPHISNFSSQFCNIDCLTLHPPRAVVCRPQQTRVDVYVFVVILQGYCFSNKPLEEPEQKLLPKKSYCPKTCYCPKICVFASLAGFLGLHPNNGFLRRKSISNSRHLAWYAKCFQAFNFAPKLLALCVTESV